MYVYVQPVLPEAGAIMQTLTFTPIYAILQHLRTVTLTLTNAPVARASTALCALTLLPAMPYRYMHINVFVHKDMLMAFVTIKTYNNTISSAVLLKAAQQPI